MSTTRASLRRLTVAIALSGITAIGAVALARPPWPTRPPSCSPPPSSSPSL
jgi:hypothetical protein